MADLFSLEYPRHVHLPSHFGTWRSRIVSSPIECQQALEDGYSLDPVIVPDETPIDAPADMPADDTPGPAVPDSPADPPKPKRGRPKKQEA